MFLFVLAGLLFLLIVYNALFYKNIPRGKIMLDWKVVRDIATLKGLNEVIFRYLVELAESHRDRGVCEFRQPVKRTVCLFKAETIEPIFKSTISITKGIETYFLKPLLKDTAFMRNGDEWRQKRKILMYAFSPRIVNSHVATFNEKACIFTDKILESMNFHEFIDIVPVISRYALDNVFETMIGTKVNAQEKAMDWYLEVTDLICTSVAKRIPNIFLWSDFVFGLTGMGKAITKKLRRLEEFTQQIRIERQQMISQMKLGTSNEPHDHCLQKEKIPSITQASLNYLDYLVSKYTEDPIVTKEFIEAELKGIPFAAHDTLTSHISWTLYALGLYPEIQDKVYTELVNVLGDDISKAITLEDIQNLKYLDCVIKESLRLFPPAWFTNRTAEENMEINGCKIFKGTNIWIFIYSLHRDPKVFPNPELFDPDRFTPVNSAGRHRYAYIPFSGGLRACPGKRFAFFEATVILVTILRRFAIKSMLPLKEVEIAPDVTLKPKNGLFMNFKLREQLREK